MDLKTLKNVEIFRVGIWKDVDYANKHLDEMIRNFEKFKDDWFRPAIKPGHWERPGQEAAGYLDKVRRKGSVLMSDFVDLPVEIYKAIKQRKYDRVSIEIVPKLEREGKVYRNVIWSLALLGVEVPEVSGLKPLRDILSSETKIVSLQTSLGIPGGFADYALIDDLPDAAFAAIEMSDGDKGKEALRHLPHHSASVTDPNDNGSVDFRRLQDALICLDRIQIPDELKREARLHVEQHARSLGIIPAEEKKQMTNSNNQTVNPPDPLDAAGIDKKFTTMQSQLDGANSKIKELSTDLKTSTDYAYGLEQKSQAERIDRKVDELRLPAMRKFAKVFYLWSTANGETPIKFSVDDKEIEMSPEAIVDEFVSTMNKASEGLFTQHSNGPAFKRDDQPLAKDPGKEVDQRVNKMMLEKTGTDYSTALRAVLDEDPELKKQYALI